MQGYIKDYRKEIESDVWLMPPLYHRIWQWLKYNVNHEDASIPMRDGSTMLIKRGQRLTSIRDLAKSVGWYEGVKWKEPNPKTVSVILDWMKSKSMISIDNGQGNRQYTLITLIKWDVYNPKLVEGNSSETVGKHLVDINNNDLNDFNDLSSSSYLREPVSEIEKHFIQRRAKGTNVGNEDHLAMIELVEYGIPTDFIKSVIDKAYQEYKPKYPRDGITRFTYCVPRIYEEWHLAQERAKGGQAHEKPKGRIERIRSGGNTTSSGSGHEGESKVYKGKWDNTDIPMPKVSG